MHLFNLFKNNPSVIIVLSSKKYSKFLVVFFSFCENKANTMREVFEKLKKKIKE